MSVDLKRTRGVLAELRDIVVRPFRGKWILPNVEKLPDRPRSELRKELEYELPVDHEKVANVLARYRIEGECVDFRIGSAVTTFEMKVRPGTRLSTIDRSRDDIARDLQTPSLRIVKSMEDSSLIGLEVENTERFTVYFKELFKRLPPKMKLPVIMGEDTYGHPVYKDLTEMPHMLVAGQTGSGKSVFINTTLATLVMTKTPAEVQFLIVDPKQVEFVAYENLPHLRRPIASDPEGAKELLDEAVEEMERRFGLLRDYRVKKLVDFNEKVSERHRLPYLVFVVDEFADLLDGCMNRRERTEVEVKITRIAQKARAVGVHMILATQKPLASVMTSRIKANMPARVAFSVVSAVDSRVILDEGGAESLTGKGDMLFRDPLARGEHERLRRVQAPWLSDANLETILSR